MLNRRIGPLGPAECGKAKAKARGAIYELLNIVHLHAAEAIAAHRTTDMRRIKTGSGRTPLYLTPRLPNNWVHATMFVECRICSRTHILLTQFLFQWSDLFIKEPAKASEVAFNSDTGCNIDIGHTSIISL